MARHSMFFAPGEWYHCYSRGIDKCITFKDRLDYLRFTELLYLANTRPALRRSDRLSRAHSKLFTLPRKDTYVDIGAWSLMPNHFHLLLYEKEERGISRFMQKLGTAYTNYFNIRYERSGGLFTRPFRARHVSNDRYIQHVVGYIHLNAADLFDSDWKEKNARLNESLLVRKLIKYPYSSLADFEEDSRPERSILGNEIFDVYRTVPPRELVKDARRYLENTN